MARSVMTYGESSLFLSNDFQESTDYNDFKYDLAALICSKYKSFDNIAQEGRYYDREGGIIAENQYCYIVTSVYFDIVSVNFCVKYEAFARGKDGIAEAFIHKIQSNVIKLIKEAGYNVLMRTATFSNGESIFSQA